MALTNDERRALAASLTDDERARYLDAYPKHDAALALALIDDDALTRNADLLWQAVDAALIEATKDRPKPNPLAPWRPSEPMRYVFSLDVFGKARDNFDRDAWGSDFEYSQQVRAEHGNLFPSKEAAEREARRTRAHRRLRQIAAVLNAGKRGPFRVALVRGEGGVRGHSYSPMPCIAGAVTFASCADADAALAQLRSEGIADDDLFTED